MRSLVVGLVLVLGACTHGGSGGNTQTIPAAAWSAPENLGHVPADTPYVFAMLEPPPARVRAALWAPIDARVIASLAQLADVPPAERETLPARDRAVFAILDDIRGTDPARWWDNLGLATGGHFVVYGLGVWPVLRIDVADATKLRRIVGRAAQIMPKAVAKQLGTIAYWQVVDGGIAVVVAVLDHEAVAAVLPERALDRLLPLVLGTQLPERSLRAVRDLPELIARHRLVPALVGFVASSHVADALTGALAPAFGGNELATPACRSDLARVTAVVPRVAFGYRVLEPKRIDAVVAIDLDPALAAQLAKLRVSLPALPANALAALSAGVDVDGLIELARGWRTALVARPFACAPLVAIGRDLVEGTRWIDKPLPPEAHGMRGAQLVVDDASPDPPAGSGHAIFAGDQIALALTHALQQLPQMQAVQIGPDGRPYELPLGPVFTLAGIAPIPSFVALRAGRAALAIGPRARDDVTGVLNAANSEHTPLVELAWDIESFMARFPDYIKAKQPRELAKLSTLWLSFDLEAGALVFDTIATWR